MPRSIRIVLAALVAAFAATLTLDTADAADPPKEEAKERVVVMYFHRTQRCPTCRRRAHALWGAPRFRTARNETFQTVGSSSFIGKSR